MDLLVDHAQVRTDCSLTYAWLLTLMLECSCDSIDMYTGKERDDQLPLSHSHAHKMRAAATYVFGQTYGLGNSPWTEDPSNPGHYTGNPSRSAIIEQYMFSLMRRKVCRVPLPVYP